MVDMEDALSMVRMPYIRLNVVGALEPLADRVRQEQWRAEPTTLFDLRNSLNILDDDFLLEAPADAVGEVIVPNEVEPFEALADVLNPIMEDLRPPAGVGYLASVPDSVWLDHPLWPEVVVRVSRLLDIMRANGYIGSDGGREGA